MRLSPSDFPMKSEPRFASGIRRVLHLMPIATGAGLITIAFGMDAYLGGTPGFGPAQRALLGLGVLCLLLPLGRSPKLSRLSVVVGALSVIAVVAFAACEAALRVALGTSLAPAYELDPVLLYRRIPGSTSEYHRHARNGGGRIVTHTGLDGFRSDTQPLPSSASVALAYGDSFIEGYFSPVEHTFTYQLEACLNKSLPDAVRVRNAGVRGYGPDQILLRLTQELPVLRPRFVVVALYAGNDFGDLLRNSLFRVGADDTLIPLHPMVAPEMQSEFLFARNAPYVLKLIQRGLVARRRSMAETQRMSKGADTANTRLLETYRGALDEAFTLYESGIQGNHPAARDFFNDGQDLDIELDPRSEQSSAKLALMRAVLAALVRKGAEYQTPVLFVIIPSPVDVVPDFDVLHVDRRQYPTFNANALTGYLDSVLTGLGAWHVNLQPSFGTHEPEKLFMHVDDPHWSDAGQGLAADVACREIIAKQSRVPGASPVGAAASDGGPQ